MIAVAARRARGAALGAVASLIFVPVALNVVGQVNGGGMQTAGAGSARWIIDGTSIRAEDGSSPRPRVEMGNLPANGPSAPGWKFRANDATGAPIFDSDGLIGVMQQLDSYSLIGAGWAGGSTGSQPAGTYQVPAGGGGSFSRTFVTSRAGLRVLIVATLCAHINNPTTSWTGRNVYLQVAGTGFTTTQTWGSVPIYTASGVAGGSATMVTSLLIPTAGTMTYSLWWTTPVAGSALAYDEYSVEVFQLGA